MSSQRLSICIEGLPWVLGNDLPSWHDGTLDAGLVAFPEIRQSIDCMGGIARYNEVEIEVLDPLTRWAPLLRVVQPTEYRVLSPNPIEYNTATGITLHDVTGLSVGDLLYAEQDTWEVTDITGDVIEVTRQIYTCLEDGWACRYQTDIWTDYTVVVSPDGPSTVMGRMVAIYLDDALEFVGRITDLRQTGRSWGIRIRSLLDVFAQAIEPPNVGLKLRYDWNYNSARFAAGAFGFSATPSSGRGGTVDQMLGDFPVTSSSPLQNSGVHGWVWVGNDDIPGTEPPDIDNSALTHGAASAMGSEWFNKELIGNCTKPLGIEPYGVMYGLLGGTFDYLEASELHNNGTAYQLDGLLGEWLRCGDQLLFVTQVDTVNGRVYFGYVTDTETATLYLYLTAGTASQTPIELQVAPIVSASTLQDAINDVLTGTGALGLGLPSSLLSDAPAVPIGGVSPVWWDWSEGGIDEDLRARGLALCLVDGQFRLRQVLPPSAAASTHDIVQADLLQGDVPQVARGHEAPVASITYADADTDLSVAWTATTGPGRAAVRTLKLSTNTRDRIVDYTAWARLQLARLRWLAPGTPTIKIRLLADVLQVGQTVTLDSRYVAANGNYKTASLPAIVIEREPVSAEYLLALNIGPTTTHCWAFSLEVDSAAGAVITPTSQADLAAFAAVVPVGTEVQITEHDQVSVLWTGTIASYQATTVTLSGSPTIASNEIAILTLAPSTDYSPPGWERQVFAANDDGEIEDAGSEMNPAKVLT